MKIQKIKNKKSQSSTIIIVLMVLVGIIAVAVIGVFIFKFIKDNAKFDEVKVDIQIDTSKGKPCYDPINKTVSFYIKRGSDEANLTGIKLIAQSSTSSQSIENRYALKFLESHSYQILFVMSQPASVEIAPFITLEGKEKLMPVISKADVIVGNCQLIGDTSREISNIGVSGPSQPSNNVASFLA